MKLQLRQIQIRFKIMVALMFVVTAVVSVITYTMTNMFHQDKKSYISDVSALVATHAAAEVDAVLASYADRLLASSRIYADADLDPAARQRLLRGVLAEFPALISLNVLRDGQEVASLYDGGALEEAGITRDAYAARLAAEPLTAGALPERAPLVESYAVSDRLPALKLSVATAPSPDEPPLVLVAVVRLDDVQRIARASTAFDLSFFDDHGRPLFANDATRLAGLELPPSAQGLEGRVVAQAREFRLNEVEMIGGFAPTQIGGLTAAALVPRSAAYFASRNLLSRLVVIAAVLLMAAALIGMVWSATLTRPLSRLMTATQAVAKGRFDVHVEVKSGDELGTLGQSFNRMATELDDRENALKQAQVQLIQSEKLAAFGQLGAGIAHEVKNPLAGIQGVVQLSLRKCEEGSPFQQTLQIIEKETKRCRTIIDNLLKFARQEAVALAPTEIGTVITDAAAIMRHQLELKNVKLEAAADENLPLVKANGNQLQQVLMNLILNAQQAMAGKDGHVQVTAHEKAPGRVEIRVQDDGPGIPKDIQARIFEPFYTTKPAGQGTGLGLSVSFGIVRDHGGEISVESEPGSGTCFVISLPVLAQSKAPEDVGTVAAPVEDLSPVGTGGR